MSNKFRHCQSFLQVYSSATGPPHTSYVSRPVAARQGSARSMQSEYKSDPLSPHPSDQDGYSMDDEEIASDATEAVDEEYRSRVPLTTLATDADFADIPDTMPRASGFNTHQYPVGSSPSRLVSPARKKALISVSFTQTDSSKLPVNAPQKLLKLDSSGAQATSSQTVQAAQDPPSSDLKDKQQLEQPALPELDRQITPTVTFYTYRAQLTFGLKTSKDGVNVAEHFRSWFKATSAAVPNFSLLPYDEGEKGLQITSLQQIPVDNPSFYTEYYFNHRVLNHGNLTGMVHFQCSVPWAKLKGYNSSYFGWLRTSNVYLNQTKFKTSTLVACGFLVGAHPGYLRRDEAEDELRLSLKLSDEDISFQLSSRTVSVPLQEGKPEKFTFQAIAVETATQFAAKLRERFYSLENPNIAFNHFPYTGMYQFVPFLKTKEWTCLKILQLAKLHVSIIQDLKPIFIANLQNIHHAIKPDGETLLQGFYGMTYTPPPTNGVIPDKVPLLHSIHNTGNKTTKVILARTEYYDEALNQLSALHEILTANIPLEYQERVFVGATRATITGRQLDSISSCNYSAYADSLLSTFNPQDGEVKEIQPPHKRVRPVPLSYAAATRSEEATVNEMASQSPTMTVSMSSLTSDDINELYEKMKHHITASHGENPSVRIEELEHQFQISTKEIHDLREHLDQQVSSIATRVDNLAADINKQNAIILAMQREFTTAMKDFSTRLQQFHAIPGVNATSTPGPSTSGHRHWGETIK